MIYKLNINKIWTKYKQFINKSTTDKMNFNASIGVTGNV